MKGRCKFSDLELLRTGHHEERAVERRRLVLDVTLSPGYHRFWHRGRRHGRGGDAADRHACPVLPARRADAKDPASGGSPPSYTCCAPRTTGVSVTSPI